MGGFSTVALEPKAVWKFWKKALTSYMLPVAVEEGYTATPKVLRRKKFYSTVARGVKVFGGYFSDKANERLHTATKTWLVAWTVVNDGAELDQNDDTYMRITVPASTARTPAVKYKLTDLPAQGFYSNGYVLLKAVVENVNVKAYVLVSKDDATYTEVWSGSPTTPDLIPIRFDVDTVYVRVDLENADTLDHYIDIYTLELHSGLLGAFYSETHVPVEDLMTVIVGPGDYHFVEWVGVGIPPYAGVEPEPLV
jgi:hypothetical protein